MAEGPIPFANYQASGLEELAGAAPASMNVVSEPNGTVRRRPGIVAWAPSTVDATGVIGLYRTAGNVVYAVGNSGAGRHIYRVSETLVSDLTPGGANALDGSKRPVFAETQAILAVSGGYNTTKVRLSDHAVSPLAGGAPTNTHVVANASRLLANHTDEFADQISYSAQSSGSSYSGFEDWTDPLTTGFFSAEGRPDPVVALHENTNELFAFGTSTLQLFAPDSQTAYAPVSTREYGCSAPYSVVKVDQSFAWLDHLRRFVLSDGRSSEVFSQPIQQTLNDMTTVSDVFGYRVILGHIDALVWTFPSDGRTFAYQQGFGWSEWMGWDGTAWSQFPVLSKCDLASATPLVGTSDGAVGQLRVGADDFGAPIRAYVTTGFQNRGTDKVKHCKNVRLTLRRGQTTSSDEEHAWLSWRNGLGEWESAVPVGLGPAGDTVVVVQLFSLGSYRRRQWRLEFSGIEDLVLVGAVEEYEVTEK